jgi:hypothetical protein
MNASASSRAFDEAMTRAGHARTAQDVLHLRLVAEILRNGSRSVPGSPSSSRACARGTWSCSSTPIIRSTGPLRRGQLEHGLRELTRIEAAFDRASVRQVAPRSVSGSFSSGSWLTTLSRTSGSVAGAIDELERRFQREWQDEDSVSHAASRAPARSSEGIVVLKCSRRRKPA